MSRQRRDVVEVIAAESQAEEDAPSSVAQAAEETAVHDEHRAMVTEDSAPDGEDGVDASSELEAPTVTGLEIPADLWDEGPAELSAAEVEEDAAPSTAVAEDSDGEETETKERRRRWRWGRRDRGEDAESVEAAPRAETADDEEATEGIASEQALDTPAHPIDAEALSDLEATVDDEVRTPEAELAPAPEATTAEEIEAPEAAEEESPAADAPAETELTAAIEEAPIEAVAVEEAELPAPSADDEGFDALDAVEQAISDITRAAQMVSNEVAATPPLEDLAPETQSELAAGSRARTSPRAGPSRRRKRRSLPAKPRPSRRRRQPPSRNPPSKLSSSRSPSPSLYRSRSPNQSRSSNRSRSPSQSHCPSPSPSRSRNRNRNRTDP